MSRTEIADKLTNFLGPEWTEPQVVYFLVQLRKMMDHRKLYSEPVFQILKFYCDWVVHISKDHIDPSTLDTLKNLQEGIEKEMKSPHLDVRDAIQFVYFEHLKPEILQLLKEEGIPDKFIKEDAYWLKFVANLIKILESQPLIIKSSHGLNIERIEFEPSADDCVVMQVTFVNPYPNSLGKPLYWYKLANYYGSR